MSQDHLQTLMMLAGLGLICWLLMRGKMRGRRQFQPATTFSLGHNANAQATVGPFSGTKSLGAPTEVLKWQVELHDLGRELKGELDSKLLAVRAMVNNYDQAARRLAEMIRLAEQVTSHPTAARNSAMDSQAIPAIQLDSEHRATIEAGRPSIPLAEVRQLAQLGWPLKRIAHATSLSESEVQQLLSLSKC